jgi:hypothetical protein
MSRQSPIRRTVGLTSVLGAVVAASLALGACGSSDSDSVAMLNTGKVERAIARSSLDQRGQDAEVSCPSDVVQEEGLEFSCTATVGQVSTTFVVVQRDGSGHVRYEAP